MTEYEAADDRPRLRRREALADAAMTTLRSAIMLGHLKPGTALSEAELAEQFEASRTPIREALRSLASEGLIELRHGRKAMVARLDPEEMRHLFEMETLLEAQAARLASVRMTDRDLAALEELQRRMEKEVTRGRRKAYVGLNQRIHRAIVAGAGNPELIRAHEHIFVRLERARNLALDTPGRTEESMQEHRQLLAALLARNGAEAARISELHKLRTAELYLDHPIIFSVRPVHV